MIQPEQDNVQFLRMLERVWQSVFVMFNQHVGGLLCDSWSCGFLLGWTEGEPVAFFNTQMFSLRWAPIWSVYLDVTYFSRLYLNRQIIWSPPRAWGFSNFISIVCTYRNKWWMLLVRKSRNWTGKASVEIVSNTFWRKEAIRWLGYDHKMERQQ